MAERFPRISLRADELASYRAAVIACVRSEEHDLCERLLGQLASLETQAHPAEPETEYTFAPPPAAAALAQRAVEHLREKPPRRRFRRERGREPRSAVRRNDR